MGAKCCGDRDHELDGIEQIAYDVPCAPRHDGSRYCTVAYGECGRWSDRHDGLSSSPITPFSETPILRCRPRRGSRDVDIDPGLRPAPAGPSPWTLANSTIYSTDLGRRFPIFPKMHSIGHAPTVVTCPGRNEVISHGSSSGIPRPTSTSTSRAASSARRRARSASTRTRRSVSDRRGSMTAHAPIIRGGTRGTTSRVRGA